MERNIEMRRKNADGSFDRYYPLVKETSILFDAGSTVLTRTDGLLTQVDETVGGVLRRRTVLSRTDGLLASAMTTLYGSDGVTVEKQWIESLVRVDGALGSVERTVTV